MTVVSVSMPESLVERLDEFVEAHGYTGRSEVIREAARGLLEEFEDVELSDRQLMSVVTVLFNYETPEIEQAMTHLRHDFEAHVVANVHSHVGDGYCLELFVLEGELEVLSTFIGNVRATSGTLSVDYSLLPVDEVPASTAEAPPATDD
ncbi:MAG: CopG family ribbon-helix-helix protein [Halobacteriales archaeon]